jgi:tyrosyl-DNA phosphodiesterase 2
MDHLEEIFGDPSSPLVVMLQEVHYESLSAILEHPWIRKNFALSNAHPPRRNFALIMVSHHIQADRLFHVPFQSRTDGSALVIDIPISSPDGESEHPKRILRLCTTHLDPPQEAGQEPEPHQLAQVSALLKATPTPSSEITAGLVGGAMNLDPASHKAANVDLCDVLEDTADSSTPALEIVERLKELRNTWGYQVPNECSARRLSKFFYTGMADAVPLLELRDLIGKIGRLGIGVKTRVKTWEYDIEPLDILSRVLSSRKSHSDIWREGGIRKELVVRVSYHFGIAIGIRVR